MARPHYDRERVLTDGKWYQANYIKTDNYTLPHYGVQTVTKPYRWYYESTYQKMRDSINPYGPRGFRAPGACSSFKVKRSGALSASWTDQSTVGPEFASRYYDVDPGHLDLQQIESAVPHIPTSLLQDNMIASLNKMLNQIPPIISIPNFLIEALEFKGTFEHYAKAVTKGGLRLKDVPGWANSTLLDYKFNLSPFVGDIEKMIGVFDRVAKRLEFLLETRGKPVRLTFYNGKLWDENPNVNTEIYRRTHNPPFKDDPTEVNWLNDFYMGHNNNDSVRGYTRLVAKGFAAKFACHWTLIQDLQGLDDAWAGLRGLIAATGFNNPAKIVWNAIPFSFVADWAFPFGSLLDRLAVQPFYGRWDVFDVSWSVKEDWALEQERVFIPDSGTGVVHTNRVNVSRYNRRLGLDFDLSQVDFTDLTHEQQLLLASLVAANTLFRSGRKHKAK